MQNKTSMIRLEEHWKSGQYMSKGSVPGKVTFESLTETLMSFFSLCIWTEKYYFLLSLFGRTNVASALPFFPLNVPSGPLSIILFSPPLSTPAGSNRSAVSILDGTAHDWHLQAHAASGRQSCVPVQGECSSDGCDPLVVRCSLSCPRDNGSDALTRQVKTPDLCDKSYCIYKGNFCLCDSETSNC